MDRPVLWSAMTDISTGQGGGAGPSGEREVRWRRVPRWLHRVAHDQVMLAAPGGEQRTLEGLAMVVWIVLDEPGTVDELVDRISDLWPEAGVGRGRLVEALEVLERHDVISAS
jgi:hypothetical protein